MMTTYFAVCNVNGPISVAIEAKDESDAVAQWREMDHRALIDTPATDAEDTLEISGDGMSEAEFDDALAAAGCVALSDLSAVDNVYTGVTRHLAGGWYLWRGPDDAQDEDSSEYHVFRFADGDTPEYCGAYETYADAVEAANTEPAGLPKHLWATARAAGHCDGIPAPPAGVVDAEPISWHGPAGWHCVIRG